MFLLNVFLYCDKNQQMRNEFAMEIMVETNNNNNKESNERPLPLS